MTSPRLNEDLVGFKPGQPDIFKSYPQVTGKAENLVIVVLKKGSNDSVIFNIDSKKVVDKGEWKEIANKYKMKHIVSRLGNKILEAIKDAILSVTPY